MMIRSAQLDSFCCQGGRLFKDYSIVFANGFVENAMSTTVSTTSRRVSGDSSSNPKADITHWSTRDTTPHRNQASCVWDGQM